MENWAYIYILNEETEQGHDVAASEQHTSGDRLGTGDRVSEEKIQYKKNSQFFCKANFQCESDVEPYPSYFFL